MTDAMRVAVLIDCDNTSWQLGAAVLAEAAAKGTLGVKRGYGDWSSQALSRRAGGIGSQDRRRTGT